MIIFWLGFFPSSFFHILEVGLRSFGSYLKFCTMLRTSPKNSLYLFFFTFHAKFVNLKIDFRKIFFFLVHFPEDHCWDCGLLVCIRMPVIWKVFGKAGLCLFTCLVFYTSFFGLLFVVPKVLLASLPKVDFLNDFCLDRGHPLFN